MAATDQGSLPSLYPSRERLVRIATMIRDAERAAPVAARRKRPGREATLLPFRRHVRRAGSTGAGRPGGEVGIAS